jgi:hypothetical protein
MLIWFWQNEPNLRLICGTSGKTAGFWQNEPNLEWPTISDGTARQFGRTNPNVVQSGQNKLNLRARPPNL